MNYITELTELTEAHRCEAGYRFPSDEEHERFTKEGMADLGWERRYKHEWYGNPGHRYDYNGSFPRAYYRKKIELPPIPPGFRLETPEEREERRKDYAQIGWTPCPYRGFDWHMGEAGTDQPSWYSELTYILKDKPTENEVESHTSSKIITPSEKLEAACLDPAVKARIPTPFELHQKSYPGIEDAIKSFRDVVLLHLTERGATIEVPTARNNFNDSKIGLIHLGRGVNPADCVRFLTDEFKQAGWNLTCVIRPDKVIVKVTPIA